MDSSCGECEENAVTIVIPDVDPFLAKPDDSRLVSHLFQLSILVRATIDRPA